MSMEMVREHIICSFRAALLYLTGVKPVLNSRQLNVQVFAGITQDGVIWLFPG